MIASGMLVNEDGQIAAPPARSAKFYSLWLLHSSIQETLHRYAIILTLLEREQTISRGALEKQGRLFAERLSALLGMNSPEF